MALMHCAEPAGCDAAVRRPELSGPDMITPAMHDAYLLPKLTPNRSM